MGKTVRRGISPAVIFVPLCVVFFNALIILFPKETVSAAKIGVKLWLENALPALLPFAAGINLLTAFGGAKILGALMEPATKKLFGVSGAGAFALITGLTSGYPLGAKTTAELYASGEISRNEGQRLLAFANNSGPLFILGAVASSMLNNAGAGYFILITHYLSAFAIGFLCRFGALPEITEKKSLKSVLREISSSNTNFGAAFSKSVTSAAETMLYVGGYIILFSVVLKAVEITNVLSRFSPAITACFSGFVEMTNGCANASQLPIKTAVICIAAIVSFGGLSVHAQSLSFISKTDLKVAPYFFAKLLHAIFASFLSFILYPLFRSKLESSSVPAYAPTPANTHDIFFQTLQNSAKLFAAFLIILSVLSLLSYFILKPWHSKPKT